MQQLQQATSNVCHCCTAYTPAPTAVMTHRHYFMPVQAYIISAILPALLAKHASPLRFCCCCLQDFAKLPWEVDMPADKAAAVLGSYLGVPNLEPAAVLDLDIDQITGAVGRS
jgi:hypothetical protein